MSQLCHVCSNVNFAAIFTPRERDSQTGELKAIFRPEWSGNGKDPALGFRSDDTTKFGRHRYRATYIRTANYDELSESTISDYEEDESEGTSEAELPAMSNEETDELVAAMSESEEGERGDEEDREENHSSRHEDTRSSQQGSTAGTGNHRSGSPGRQRSRSSESRRISRPGSRSAASSPVVDTNVEVGDRDLGNELQETTSLPPSTPSRVRSPRSPRGHRSSRSTSPTTSRSPRRPRRPWRGIISDDDTRSRDRSGSCSSDNGASSFTWSGDSRFDRDNKIDIEKQLDQNWGYRHGHFYNLGTIWDVRSRRFDCNLCYKLWNRMRNEWDVKNTFLLKSRCLFRLLEFKSTGKEAESKRDVAMPNLLFIFGFKTVMGWNIRLSFVFQGTHIVSRKDIRASEDDDTFPYRDELYGESRTVYRICDFELFRKWLAYCEAEHHHEEPEITGNMVIRLIDVTQKCLIEWTGPTAEAPRFVALSYVWGPEPQRLLLTTSNVTDMMLPDSLESKPLSKTIEDAIDLVDYMDEKYLWVDALCILQDSPEDQAVQIPQMYDIYSKAVLTIVAAAGNDADAGLQGVRHGSRGMGTFALDLDNIRVTMRPSAKLWRTDHNIGFKENYLSGCQYLSRAWTLQESLLSKRTLVFAYGQVYFECSTGTWCEGTYWESCTLRFVGQRAIKESTPIDVWEDNFDRQAYDHISSEDEATYKVQPNSYECLVREYTQRKLSHDADILNAFTGIITLIAKKEQTKFLYALREKNFGNDLLFNISTSIPRREFQEGGEMPSWSWLSWKGTAEFANEARNSSSDLVMNLVPCDGVRCYLLDIDQNGRKYVRVINENGGWQFRSGYWREGEGIWDPTWFHAKQPSPESDESGEDEDKVTAWAMKVDAEISDDQDQTATSMPDRKSSPQPTNTTSSETNIPTYSQTLTLSTVESLKSFPHLLPSHHIIFHTFSTTVELITEEDEYMKFLTRNIMAGTKRPRRNGVNSYRDSTQRNLYVCTKEREQELALGLDTTRRLMAEDRILAALDMLQPGAGRGPFFGRIPEMSRSWDRWEYMSEVPDGVYTVLWMNNNQLPMFGHLLCRPVRKKDGDGNDSGILERVCGVLGPTEILTSTAQKKWRAKWGIHVLG